MKDDTYILTLSCQDTTGIVAAVSGFLAEHGGFILESAQFGDFATGRFFMRTTFRPGRKLRSCAELSEQFLPIAKQFSMNWTLHDASNKPRVLIMVSKESHCFHNLLHRFIISHPSIDIPAVVSNHETLRGMAEAHSIPFHHLPVTQDTKAEQEEKLWELIQQVNADVVVLARYMQILSDDLCAKLKGRAINIHHSFLPSFKGANPYRQAFDRGVKIIGATAHYVTGDLDEGPIIEQEVIRVNHTHKPEDLRSLGQDIESRVLSNALKYHVEHRVLLNDNKTVVFS